MPTEHRIPLLFRITRYSLNMTKKSTTKKPYHNTGPHIQTPYIHHTRPNPNPIYSPNTFHFKPEKRKPHPNTTITRFWKPIKNSKLQLTILGWSIIAPWENHSSSQTSKMESLNLQIETAKPLNRSPRPFKRTLNQNRNPNPFNPKP